MKDSLLQYGFKPDELDMHLAIENEIALNRGRKVINREISMGPGDENEPIMAPDKMVSEPEELAEEPIGEEEPALLTHEEQVSADLKQQETQIFDSTSNSLTAAVDKSQEKAHLTFDEEDHMLTSSAQNTNTDTESITDSIAFTTHNSDEDSRKLIEEDDKFLSGNTIVQDGKEFTTDSNDNARAVSSVTEPNNYVASEEEKLSPELESKHSSDQGFGDAQQGNVSAAVYFKTSGNSASKGVVAIASLVLYIPFLSGLFV